MLRFDLYHSCNSHTSHVIRCHSDTTLAQFSYYCDTNLISLCYYSDTDLIPLSYHSLWNNSDITDNSVIPIFNHCDTKLTPLRYQFETLYRKMMNQFQTYMYLTSNCIRVCCKCASWFSWWTKRSRITTHSRISSVMWALVAPCSCSWLASWFNCVSRANTSYSK